ncbi:hypothetical protein NYO91_17095 [Arhodomonas aquaeolei]|uniref:arsenate reductase/protein-tyrosine-phosphatase family protein n=1 Tax=Arhodomonas TaxID=2368 RepID=UPI002168155B|nr:hypothetical protein [Arhodomonas aquaeolei]MCS4505801.1 hypothetical protein [Arhodomonas aquaeolei]
MTRPLSRTAAALRGRFRRLNNRAAALWYERRPPVVDWRRVERLVVVCAGNVCRSPYAQTRALSLGMPSVSFGLVTTGGVPADATAQLVARRRGVALERHRSVQPFQIVIGAGDLVLCMEPGQLRALRRRVRSADGQAALIGLWANPPRAVIEDPYGRGEACFEVCFTQLDEALKALQAQWHATQGHGQGGDSGAPGARGAPDADPDRVMWFR